MSAKSTQARKLLEQSRSDLAKKLGQDRSRNRGRVVAELHMVSNMLEEGARFFSQSGQDRIIDRILDGKTGGVFVDVGGYDGVTASNSLFFELFRGWSGLLIEPAPAQLQQAKAVRRCPCLGCGVTGRAGTAEFMEITAGFTQMSGFVDLYDADLLKRVRENKVHAETMHRLETKPLGDILSGQGLSVIDYLSLDTEGSEMDILRAFPFDDFDIAIWSIENNAQDSELPDLMRDNGYDLVEFAGVDDLFRARP